MQRTVKDLVNGISEKFNIEPQRVTRVTHVNARGLQIVVDEDVVRELPEGQDMLVEFAPVPMDRAVKPEYSGSSTDVLDDDILSMDLISDPLELWLDY